MWFIVVQKASKFRLSIRLGLMGWWSTCVLNAVPLMGGHNRANYEWLLEVEYGRDVGVAVDVGWLEGS